MVEVSARIGVAVSGAGSVLAVGVGVAALVTPETGVEVGVAVGSLVGVDVGVRVGVGVSDKVGVALGAGGTVGVSGNGDIGTGVVAPQPVRLAQANPMTMK